MCRHNCGFVLSSSMANTSYRPISFLSAHVALTLKRIAHIFFHFEHQHHMHKQSAWKSLYGTYKQREREKARTIQAKVHDNKSKLNFACAWAVSTNHSWIASRQSCIHTTSAFLLCLNYVTKVKRPNARQIDVNKETTMRRYGAKETNLCATPPLYYEN